MDTVERTHRNDIRIAAALTAGWLNAETETGVVTGPSGRPVGAADQSGYLRLRLPSRHTVTAHRVVWISAYGMPAPGMQINHRNRVRSDNRLVNLELVTPAENTGHHFGTLTYVGVRPEDIETVSADRPDWYRRALVLAASGQATAADVAALRSEVSFAAEETNPLSQHQRLPFKRIAIRRVTSHRLARQPATAAGPVVTRQSVT